MPALCERVSRNPVDCPSVSAETLNPKPQKAERESESQNHRSPLHGSTRPQQNTVGTDHLTTQGCEASQPEHPGLGLRIQPPKPGAFLPLPSLQAVQHRNQSPTCPIFKRYT